MKKLFRRSLALVLALVSVLGLLTACGGGEAPAPEAAGGKGEYHHKRKQKRK